MWQERADYGHFFYRIPNGESAADAYDRISSFNESLWCQFSEDDFASVCVLVTHGLMSRVFLMKWYMEAVAYRVCKPGDYVESFKMDALTFAEDGSIVKNSLMDQCGKLFKLAGAATGQSFMVINENLQRKGLDSAGFMNIVQWDFKCPLTPWPMDKKFKRLGQCS
ncbi:hypothetical protein N0V88_001469 [Collariella sp. IMI 366227]|nr:hypothetical protein N0V88_001469 [Collariella sp. IMI 366227]